MLFTPEQLQQIRKIIDKYHNAFIVNAVSENAVDPDIVKQLRKQGLVDVDVTSVKDSYIYGQLVGLLNNKTVANMSYTEFKKYVRKNPVPLGPAEKQAVAFAELNAAQYISGLGNRVNTQTGDLLIEADQAQRSWLEQEIRTKTAENIHNRQTVKQLASDLKWMSEDWGRDWDRIAVTEKHNAMQRGLADHYRDRYGADSLVAKRSMPDACQHCKRVYLDPFGQPRIFKLSTLEANGTNVGRKANDWKAVVGPVHPHCHPKGSKVVTNRGEINIEEVRPGDLVPTHTGIWRRVTHVWESGYSGIFVNIVLKNGQKVSATPNHLFLTDRGWISAKCLNDSDNLFEVSSSQVKSVFKDLQANQKPTCFSKNTLFASILHGFSRSGVPITAIYFDGQLYIREGQINIDNSQSVIGDRLQSQSSEPPVNHSFVGRMKFTDLGLRFGEQLFTRYSNPSSSLIRFLGDFPLLDVGEARHTQAIGFRTCSRCLSDRFDSGNDRVSSHTEMGGYLFYRKQLVEVQIQDGCYIEFNPTTTFSFDHCLKTSCTAIANVNITYYSGNVYNLTVEKDNSYIVNGVVSHNCQCQLVSVPDGWGFNEDGDLVPGGNLGYVHDKEDKLVLALQDEQDLIKSFQIQDHIVYQGLPIAIETLKNAVRTWKSPDGSTGSTKLTVAYGYIKQTKGTDEDEIDCFVGPDPKATNVYIVHQQDPQTGMYDEEKCMLGFPNEREAERVYRENYDVPAKFILTISPMAMDHFKRYIAVTKPNKGEMLSKAEDTQVLNGQEGSHLVIPLAEKRYQGLAKSSTLHPSQGAVTDQTINRNPSGIRGGGVENYVIPVPGKKDAKKKSKKIIDKEDLFNMDRDPSERSSLKFDKEIYHFVEPQRYLQPMIISADLDTSDARKDHKKNKATLIQNLERNKGRPKNTVKPEMSKAEDQIVYRLESRGDHYIPSFSKAGEGGFSHMQELTGVCTERAVVCFPNGLKAVNVLSANHGDERALYLPIGEWDKYR